MSKYGKIKTKVKKPWELAHGHNSHRSGSGSHDNRPRRIRARMDARRVALAEYK